MAGNAIQVNQAELDDFYKETLRMAKAITRKEVNKIHRRNAKPMLSDMQQSSPSVNIAAMTNITTRQGKRPRAPRVGIRIGVINNDAALFPDFSAPALASVLEHGTGERFRQTAKMFGITIGVASTGSVKAAPWLRPAWDRNIRNFITKTEASYIKKVEQ